MHVKQIWAVLKEQEHVSEDSVQNLLLRQGHCMSVDGAVAVEPPQTRTPFAKSVPKGQTEQQKVYTNLKSLE